MVAKACAIWLRLALPTSTKRTRILRLGVAAALVEVDVSPGKVRRSRSLSTGRLTMALTLAQKDSGWPWAPLPAPLLAPLRAGAVPWPTVEEEGAEAEASGDVAGVGAEAAEPAGGEGESCMGPFESGFPLKRSGEGAGHGLPCALEKRHKILYTPRDSGGTNHPNV